MAPSIPLGSSLKTGALFGGGFSLAGKELQDCYAGEVNLNTGKRHGRGKYVYPNKAFSYEGEYLHGKKHGFGRFEIKGHSYYEGEFSEDEVTGKGLQVYENGSTYEGDFVLGEKHGKGISFDKRRNERYTGEFERNARHGEGLLVLMDTETTYEGNFEKQKPSGRGKVLVPATQQIYEGNFVRDESQTLPGLAELKISLSGDGGLVESAEGRKEGQFENSMLQGQGLHFDAKTGITYEGLFDQDKQVNEPKRITCSFIQLSKGKEELEEEEKQEGQEKREGEGEGEEEEEVAGEESVTENPTEAFDEKEKEKENEQEANEGEEKVEDGPDNVEALEKGHLVLESRVLELNSNEIEATWGSFGIQICVETEAKQAPPSRPANPEPHSEAEAASGSEAASQETENATADSAKDANDDDAKNNTNEGDDDDESSTSEPKFCVFSNESGRLVHLKCKMEEGAPEEGQPPAGGTEETSSENSEADPSAESAKRVKSLELDLPRTSKGLVMIEHFDTVFNTLEVGKYTLEFSSGGLDDNQELTLVIK